MREEKLQIIFQLHKTEHRDFYHGKKIQSMNLYTAQW